MTFKFVAQGARKTRWRFLDEKNPGLFKAGTLSKQVAMNPKRSMRTFTFIDYNTGIGQNQQPRKTRMKEFSKKKPAVSGGFS
jgi:hypothetical protein